MRLKIVCALMGLSLSLAVALNSLADDWTQFRGPNATGVAGSALPLPTEFSKDDKVLWSAEPGEGIACPVIAKGRLFTTGMTGEQEFSIFGYDAKTGKELWKKSFETGALPDITPPNTQASSTPATDGERVYVYFSTIGMLALDATSGSLLWKHDVPMPFYLMGWGAAHSPILYEDLLIFNQDDDLAPFLLALDKNTGEVRWKTERPEMLAGYSLPVLCTANGRTDVVVSGSGKLKGYDPKTGKEIWTCNTLLRTMMTTPAVEGDKIYISVQSYGDADRVLKYALLQWKDTNQDSKLSKSELDKAFWKKFDAGDKNKDGFLEEDEIDVAFQAPSNRVGGGQIVQAVQGGGTGDVTKTHLLWNLEKHRSPSNIASPLVVDGNIFLVKKGGIAACLDAKTGDSHYEQKRIRNLGNYYASPIAGDGKIYVLGENGFMVVLEQGPKLKVLAKNDMGGQCSSTPAISDGRIYVRTLNKIFCFSEEAK